MRGIFGSTRPSQVPRTGMASLELANGGRLPMIARVVGLECPGQTGKQRTQ